MSVARTLPRVRGRDNQLAVISRRLDQLRAGTGSVVVIEGGPGLGKTRMLQEAFDRASDLGIRVGYGMADAVDSVVDLAPLLEALFDKEPPLLDRSLLSDAHAAPEQRFWLLHDLESLLEQTARNGPLLIGLDDLQWADTGTAAAVHTLPSRLASVPISWLLASRPGQGSSHIRAALHDVVLQGGDLLGLEPLSEHAVAEVVADLLAAQPDAAVLRSAYRTKGNPFLLVELMRGLEEDAIIEVGADGCARLMADRMPTRVSDDMRQRLSRLPERAERAAVNAASLGRRFSADDLAAMSDLSVAQLFAELRTLLDAAIFAEYDDRLMFGHDLIRDAVRASVPNALRRALDRRGADVLLARGALPVEVAVQLSGSAEEGDQVAIATLDQASEALSSTDPAAAADLAQRALDLAPPQHPRRGPLVARRAISLFAAGLGAEAKRFADTELGGALPPEQQAQVRLSIASMFALSPDVRLDSARQALALPGLPPDLRAWLEALVLHNTVVAVRTDLAVEMAEGVHKLVAESTSAEARFAFELAAGGLAYQQLDFQSAIHHLDRASHVGTTENVRARLAHYFRCWPLSALDRFAEANAVTQAGIADAARDRQNWALRIFETWRGHQALLTGRLADAAVALDRRSSPTEANQIVGIIDAADVTGLGRLKLHQGDERGAREVAQACSVMLGATTPGVRHHAVWYLASHAMYQGNPKAAYEIVRRLGATERLSLFPLFPHDVSYDAELLHIALAAGDDELVDQLVALTEERAAKNPSTASVRAAAVHVRGLANRSVPDLELAVAEYGRAGRSLAQSAALEDLARQLVEQGARIGAVEALDRALVLDVTAGASRDAARVRSALRQLGVRRRVAAAELPRSGWAALTTSERAVAELVCDGRTNRQIADQLFVSPHTVNTHLRHIFDKLGVKSRVELTRVADALHAF